VGGKKMEIKSSAFDEGAFIPRKYTCDGIDISPPLEWSLVPDGTKTFALICDDPDWKQQIENALADSNIAILIISNDFLISDIIRSKELPKILEKSDQEGTKVICLIARPCRFLYHSELSKFQAVNPPNKPLSSLSQNDREIVMLKLTEDIEGYLN
jgi:hypothetical protein